MTLSPRKQQALDTKKRIYESVVKLLKTDMIENIKIEDICNEANVSTGTFYHYFKNKEDVFKAGMERFDDFFEKEIKNIVITDPFEKLKHSIFLYLQAMDSRTYYPVSLLLKYELSLNDEHILSNRALYKYLRENIYICIQDGVLIGNPDTITDEIYRLIKGTIFQWVINKGNFTITDTSNSIVDIILEYYKPK